ncbi:MAG: hypothetical protein P4M11_14355 [Candidatus Pacebacteria bacterium]|nr:hypothetical protein [Candidatus Paceibacterota bacterium]
MDVKHADGHVESKILLFLYSPDAGPTKGKFMYAAGKDSLKKKIGSVHHEYQVNAYEDLDEAKILVPLVH